jgi:endonuclease III
MKKSHSWNQVIETLWNLYGGQRIELIYETPFQLLCAVILSAQTTDKQVNKITPPFFLKVREAKDVIDLPIETIEHDLKYVNFYRNKSRYIKQTGTIIATDHDGIIPNDLALLETYP